MCETRPPRRRSVLDNEDRVDSAGPGERGAQPGERRQARREEGRARQTPTLDGVEGHPDEADRQQSRQQQLQGSGQRRTLDERLGRDAEQPPRRDEHQDQRRSRRDEDARRPRPPPDLDEGPRAEEQRDGEDRQDGGHRAAAPALSRRRELVGRHLRLDERPAAVRSDEELIRPGRRREAAVPHPHQRRDDGGGQREAVGQREARIAEELLDDDRREPRTGRAARIGDRLDAHEAGPERPGQHEQGGRAVDAVAGQLGDASRPRERSGRRRIDGHARPAREVVGQRRGGRLEQGPGGRLVARRRAQNVVPRCEGRGNPAERVGAGVEPVPELGLDLLECRLVGSAEPRPFDREAGETDGKRGHQTGAHQAQQQCPHGKDQHTRVL